MPGGEELPGLLFLCSAWYFYTCQLPYFLKNIRHISILRRYFLCGGTLFALGRKSRQRANVGRFAVGNEKGHPEGWPCSQFYRYAALRSLHLPSMFKSRCSSC